MYYLTPTELAAKIDADPTFREHRREGRRARRAGLDPARSRAASEYAFRVTDGAQIVPGRLPRHRARHVHRRRRRRGRGPHGRRRHLPRDDAARQVRVALRERAGETSTSRRRATRRRSAARVILVGELSLWVALLMAAWAATVSFAGGALAPRRSRRQRRRGALRDVRDGRARVDRPVDGAAHARLLAQVRRVAHQREHAEGIRLHGVLGRPGGIAAVLGADPRRCTRAIAICTSRARNRELVPWATGTLAAMLLFFLATTCFKAQSVRRGSTGCRPTGAG